MGKGLSNNDAISGGETLVPQPPKPIVPLRVGVDLVQVERIALLLDRYGERFSRRVFTGRELLHCRQRPDRMAAHFAAKEAVSKVLGTGIGRVAWREIEVINDASGRPGLALNGAAAQLAAELDLHQWAISLSHTQEQAIAFVVATG